MQEWIKGIEDVLIENGIVEKNFHFNEEYQFHNKNLTNLAFVLNDKKINLGALAIYRLKIREQFGAMWLSDYVDNYLINDIKI